MKRIVILYDPAFPASEDIVLQAAASAKELGIEAVTISIDEGQDLAPQLEQVAATGADAVYVPPGIYWSNVEDILLEFQARSRLPILNSQLIAGKDPPFAGVVSYGPSQAAALRRAASFIDAILKGARPGDLPVEAPTVFDFVVNGGEAKAIGISIPPSILAQATQVIQ